MSLVLSFTQLIRVPTMGEHPTVILLMRKKMPYNYSIERLFESLEPLLSTRFEIRVVHVPFCGTSPVSFIRNLIFTARLHADVIHVTGDIHYCALAIPRRRCVLTIMDLVSLNRLRGARKRIFSFIWYSVPLRWAGHITAISEETRRQLEENYPSTFNRVTVVPCSVDPAFEHNPRLARASTDSQRLLQVGTGANKNLDRVATAASSLPLHFRIIGPLSHDQRKLLSSLDLEWSSAEQLSTEELIKEYQESDALAFVSTYEGFGLPVVEAQAIGLPILTSNIEPMEDVAGEGALLVNPYDEIEIRSGLRELLNSPDLSRSLVSLGKSNAERFSAKNVAGKYAGIYGDILKHC